MSGQWNDMLAKIQADIEKSEQAETAKEQLQSAEETQVPEEFLEAAPDLFEKHSYADRRAEQQNEEDAALKKLQISQVYRKLTGDSRPKLKSGGKGELLIFCPSANHHNTESEAACINIKTNTWVCYGQCDSGGGIIDMVAAAAGMTFGKAAKGKDFAKAKQLTLEKFCGWTFERDKLGYVGKSPAKKKQEIAEFEAEFGKLPSEDSSDDDKESHREAPATKPLGMDYAEGDEDLPSIGPTKFSAKDFGVAKPSSSSTQPKVEPTPIKKPKPEPTRLEAKPSNSLKPALTITPDLSAEMAHDGEELLPEINDIFDNVPPGTPLYEFMKATWDTKPPKEYLLFRGLQLLALSAGSYTRGRVGGMFKLTLSTLFVGASGAGKSAGKAAVDEILDHPAFGWRPSPPVGTKFGKSFGVRKFQSPGSGEALIDQFGWETSEGIKYDLRDVMGFLEIDEFAAFMGKSYSPGSILMQTFQKLENSGGLNYQIDAVSRAGGVSIAINPNLVFSSGTQPSVLGSLLGKGNIGNGLLARFEVVTGNKSWGFDPFSTGMKDITICKDLYVDLAVYYRKKADPDDPEGRRLFIMDVEQEARQAMRDALVTVEGYMKDDDAKSRFDLKLFKLAALFAVNRKNDLVTEEDIKSALWVMEYLNRSTTLASQKTTSAAGEQLEEDIIKAVASRTKSRGYATTGDVNGKTKGKGWDPADVHRRLEMLVERGEIIIDPRSAARGPKSVRYLHPGSLDKADLQVVRDAQDKTTNQRKSK